MRFSAPFPFELFMSRGASATERTVTEILWWGQEGVGTPTRGPAAGWR
jgi:hypothetical protein